MPMAINAKHLTALAVLVMAVCALCVVAPSGAVDAEGEVGEETYTVQYVLNGEVADEDKDVVLSNYSVGTDKATKVHWYLQGDVTRTALTSLSGLDTTKIENKTIVLEAYVIVKFAEADGTTILYQTVLNYGEVATAPAVAKTEGYIFDAWTVPGTDEETGKEIAVEVTEFAALTGDTTYTATYVTDITLRFVVDGTIKDTLLSEMKVPEIPTKTGYTAKGWIIDGDETKTVLADSAAIYAAVYGGDEDVILTAYYVESAEPAPAPAKDSSGIYACLIIIGAVVIVGAVIFVWTLKKDKNN